MAKSGSQGATKIYSGRGHVVGHVRAGALRLTERSSRHFLRRPPAIALEVDVIEQAERAGAARIEVRDLDTGRTYTANLNEFRAGAFALERGYGAQLALPLRAWHVHAGEDLRQLALWGGRG